LDAILWRVIVKVAIVTRMAKPDFFNPGNYDEVWGYNSVGTPWIRDWSRRFQLHYYDHLVREWEELEAIQKWLSENRDVPLYTIEEWPAAAAPNQRIFPREQMRGLPRPDYHCCSIDWLIAYAISEGATHISLHGVSENSLSGRPLSSQSCIEFWCGVAEGMGIPVTVHPDCCLFSYLHLVRSNAVYGYDRTAVLVEDRRNIG
jgi:hypothetical protein